jgi:MOSC domain-containing protein YiiM
MEVVSVNVGKPAILNRHEKELLSGIVKSPVSSALHLSHTQLEGDGQADLVNHGGPDKALCVYGAEHYSYWEGTLGRQLEYGAFGENISVRWAKRLCRCLNQGSLVLNWPKDTK